MNTNVGDMPLDIFADYVTEQLNIEFPQEYLFFIITEFIPILKKYRYNQGCGRYVDESGYGYNYVDLDYNAALPLNAERSAGFYYCGHYGTGDSGYYDH